jgi:hypothetical protein
MQGTVRRRTKRDDLSDCLRARNVGKRDAANTCFRLIVNTAALPHVDKADAGGRNRDQNFVIPWYRNFHI